MKYALLVPLKTTVEHCNETEHNSSLFAVVTALTRRHHYIHHKDLTLTGLKSSLWQFNS